MSLAAYQRALLQLSFAAEPDAEAFDVLGDRERFQLYRHMIRTRLLGMTKLAFRATLEAIGEPAFEVAFSRFLAASAPRSPLIRDAVAAFGAFARADRELLAQAPAHTPDLLSFEETKWRLAYLQGATPRVGEAGVRELDFEGAPVLNPVLEILELGYTVHEPAPRPLDLSLLVYRPAHVDEVRWYPPDPLFAEVLRSARTSRRALAELVRQAAASQQRETDEALLEQLATSVTLALERGVLIGSCDPA
jgi:hypothetical protein